MDLEWNDEHQKKHPTSNYVCNLRGNKNYQPSYIVLLDIKKVCDSMQARKTVRIPKTKDIECWGELM